MPKVMPFRGVRYGAALAGDLAEVTAPPYDMISPAEQEALYRRHPNNVVRLILSRESEGGRPVDRYGSAAATYRSWREEGVLVADPEPALYLYREDYAWAGAEHRRLGLVARVGLEEFGKGAFAHESTLSGPKADRLRLLQACRAHFSQVFALYSDPEGTVEARLAAATESAPVSRFEDDRKVRHQLWRVEDPALHHFVREQLEGRPFIIADGHHRYETALEFRRLMREAPEPFRDSYESVMMCLVRMESPGLTILPFHRLLRLAPPEDLEERLARAFETEEVGFPDGASRRADAVRGLLPPAPEAPAAFGLYRGGGRLRVLRLRPGYDAGRHLRPGTSPLVGRLDVTILHQMVFGALLGLDEQRLVQEGAIRFLPRPEEAAAEVDAGSASAVFFMRPAGIEQVWRIATAGERMPQKSTNFYPKLATGLVLNEL